jgi:ATP-dependent Clp protease ATP-binding subunit ClpC
MLDRDMTVELTQSAKEQLIEVGFDPTLGARPLRRAVQHEVEDRLSERILQGELGSGDHVHVDFLAGEFVFTTTKHEQPVAIGAGVGASPGTGAVTPDLAASGE